MIFNEDDIETQFTTFAGFDVHWYATDLSGNLGFFTSGGTAPIPSKIAAIEHELTSIHKYVSNMPSDYSLKIEVGSHWTAQSVMPSMKKHFAEYKNGIMRMAQRGIFCFDAEPNGDPEYVRLAKPDRPIRINALPPFPADLISKIILNCDFAENEILF